MSNCSKGFCRTFGFLVRDFGVWYAIFRKSTRFGTSFVVDNQCGTRCTRFFLCFAYRENLKMLLGGEDRKCEKSCKSRPQNNFEKFLCRQFGSFCGVFGGYFLNTFIGFLVVLNTY